MKFNIELMKNSVPFCIPMKGRTEEELLLLEAELERAEFVAYERVESVHLASWDYYGVDGEDEMIFNDTVDYFKEGKDTVTLLKWEDLLLESEKVIPEEPSFEVGQQVTVSNVKGYELSEFGGYFLGESCIVRAIFNSSNPNEGDLDMVAVSLEDGTCGCFRVDMVEAIESEPTWQEEVKDYLGTISRDIGNLDTEWEINRSGLVDEEYLEMCRIALRAKGEIE
ncbi:hypothetical protein VP501E541_P0041 [Vibrio phage 501E54-1]|nr:hypothetical protein VP501E541_P0041 [Vibrio phage 501E54-1]